jgi:hypothetical protein
MNALLYEKENESTSDNIFYGERGGGVGNDSIQQQLTMYEW